MMRGSTRALALLSIFLLARALPRGFNDERIVSAILDAKTGELERFHDHVPFHFRLDADTPLVLLEEDSKEAEKKEDPPIKCETICKPMEDNDENVEEEGKETAKKNKEEEKTTERAPTASFLETGESIMLQVRKTICEGKGGKWVDEQGNCAPFMKSTEQLIAHNGENIFKACKEELGNLYVPCSPYQALALAHMYDVPDHSYFWLWPGGRHDQVEQAVFKQDIGNNPKEGMDTCPEEQHLGFFHNWNEAHVDSWGCLHESQELPVLCCRQN